MCNYFGLGLGARILIGFEKNRSNSQVKNILTYAWEGVKKCFQKTLRMNDIISYMWLVKGDEDSIVNEEMIDLKSRTKEVTFKTKGLKVRNEQLVRDRNIFLKGNPVNIICLNIPSYMGGGSNP